MVQVRILIFYQLKKTIILHTLTILPNYPLYITDLSYSLSFIANHLHFKYIFFSQKHTGLM